MSKQVNLNELQMIINDIEKDVNILRSECFRSKTIEKDEIPGQDDVLLAERRPWDEVYAEYSEKIDKVFLLKTKLNYVNNTTEVKEGLSILGAINRCKALNSKLSRLEEIDGLKPLKNRKFDGTGGSSYYRKVELNFTIDVKAEIEKIKNEINDLNLLIAAANNSTVIEIDL